ncbi:MAG: ATP-binding protein [Bacteroidota bacterium]
MFVSRTQLKKQIENSIKDFPVTALLGPRQCGKTTIARIIAKSSKSAFFDLENPSDIAGLSSSPMITLESQTGLVILDEIQRMPELLPLLRVLADRADHKAKYLILGSASPTLVRGVSESLAGRISFIDMSGFNLLDIGVVNWKKLWLKGSFPDSYLANSDSRSFKWRDNFIRTFLERDIPQLGISIPASSLRRFWTMVGHYHGQIWNGSEFARSIGASEPTAKKYLDILCDAYMVRQLLPWHENLKKRQVKSPKVYVRDSGILHSLLSLEAGQIFSHPKLGASWEGFVIEQILDIFSLREAYFWATHGGAELDLLVNFKGNRIGFEVKYSDAPVRTRSMKSAIEDLSLHYLYIVFPGKKGYALDKNIRVIGIEELNLRFST